MADTKITGLNALTVMSSDDLFVVVDDPSGTPETKKITKTNFESGLSLTASQVSDFDTEVSNNVDVTANTSDRHDAVTIGTANGLSLSTQELSLALSTSSATGALSSTDWTTFNSKQDQDVVLNDLSGISFSQGDIIYYDGSNLVSLGAGTDGYFLKTQGAGADPVWADAGSASLPVVDTTSIVKGSVDDTKLVRFEVDGLTTATTRILTVQDKDITIAGTDDLHDEVTLAGTPDYLTISGQVITRNQIDLTTDVTGVLPDANIADDITLTDITQITNRSHTDLQDIGTNTHAQIDTHIASTSNPHSVIASQVNMLELGTATYDDVQDWINTVNSAGKISGGSFTDNGDGTIDVSAGTGLIKTTNSDTGELKFFDWSASSSVSLTDNDSNYVYVEYNAGSPQVTVSTSAPSDHNTNVLLGLIYREGTELHEIIAGQVITNYANKTFWKDIDINGKFQRSSGLIISETGTRNFALTAGSIYGGLTKVSVSAFDSSGADTFTYYYRDGSGGWTKVTSQSQIDNTYYDDGSGTLAELSDALGWRPAHYGVHWVYSDIDGDEFVVYGQGDYTLTEAQDAQPPSSIPELLTDVGGIVGKIIVQKDATSFESVQSAFDITFSANAASDHNNLSGLQGGIADEYYHLTNTDYTDLTDGGDSSLHYHSTDRDRANHTGTQTASTISDFDTEVSNNTDVTSNTSFRTTPSTVITAGNNISWSGNTLNVSSTGAWTTFSNNDIDTGTEVACTISIDENCAYEWLFTLTDGTQTMTGKIIGSLLKVSDGYGGYTYSVGSNMDAHTIGDVSSAITIFVYYNTGTNALELKVTVDSDDWNCEGKYMRIDS